MLILGIDTSTKFLSLALSEGKRLLGEFNLEVGRELSDKLIPTLNNFLKKHKKDITDIKGFSVGIGPGSFTGLRIGISTIKGFALAQNLPIVGISSLDILAEGIFSKGTQHICPIVDAKRNLVYSCIYKKTKAKLRRISRYFLIPIDELLKKINSETIFVGDGIGLYKKVVKKKLGKKAVFASDGFWYPRADNLLALSCDKFKKHPTQDAHRLLPVYLYPKECQVSPVRSPHPRCGSSL